MKRKTSSQRQTCDTYSSWSKLRRSWILCSSTDRYQRPGTPSMQRHQAEQPLRYNREGVEQGGREREFGCICAQVAKAVWGNALCLVLKGIGLFHRRHIYMGYRCRLRLKSNWSPSWNWSLISYGKHRKCSRLLPLLHWHIVCIAPPIQSNHREHILLPQSGFRRIFLFFTLGGLPTLRRKVGSRKGLLPNSDSCVPSWLWRGIRGLSTWSAPSIISPAPSRSNISPSVGSISRSFCKSIFPT